MTKFAQKLKTFYTFIIVFIKKQRSRLFPLSIIAFLLFLFPSPNVYYSMSQNEENSKTIPNIDLPKPPPYPLNKTNIYPDVLTAEGVIVMDIPSGVIVYSKNPDSRLSPASTTKIMTALIGLDRFELEDVLTVKSVEKNGSTMGLLKDEKITFESLLYGILVASANDAATTIAENYNGGVSAFIEAMNQKASDLKLYNTHFTNPIGFDNPNHYTSAKDLAKLTGVALKDKTLSKIVGTRAITVSDVNYLYFHDLRNVNELLGEVPGMAGVKTGYTQNASECLVSLVKRGENEVLTVVLRSNDRFAETANLIAWFFENYKWVDVLEYQNSIQEKTDQ